MLEIDLMPDWLAIVAALTGGGVAAGAAFYIVGRRVERRVVAAAARAVAADNERLLADARQRMVLAAKEELLRAREVWDEEVGRRRREIERREDQTAQQLAGLETQARELGRREQALHDRERALGVKEAEARARLEQVAGLTAPEAKQELLRGLEDEARGEAAALARDLKEQAKKNADREAKKILAVAIQRIAAEHTAESTVATNSAEARSSKGSTSSESARITNPRRKAPWRRLGST